MLRRHDCRSTCQVDIHSAFIRLGLILQSKLLTDLFNLGFNLLDMTRTVVSFTHNNMEMCLTVCFGISDSFF